MSNTALPNLRLDEFREVYFLENELDMEVFVEPIVNSSKIRCPHCNSLYTISHGSEERFFRDLNMYEKRVGVAILGRRYKCKDCGKTFVLEFQCIDPNGKISNRLKKAIQEKALNRTFTSVAEEYGLGVTTVLNAFSEYSEILNLRPQVKAPRVLGIDECHLQKVMRPVYVDVENGTILEMGRSVKQKDVIRDLQAFEGLENVEVVTTDMNQGYRGAIQALLPNAVHVVDKFHVIKLFINTVEEARKGILEHIKNQVANILDPEEKAREERLLAELNVDSFMFKMNPKNMSDWRFERLTRICETYPAFAELAAVRQGFLRIYECSTSKEAFSAFCMWCSTIPGASYYWEMGKFARKTVMNWKEEIFAYFTVDGRKTNAVTERLNGAIKSMQNMGRGYSYPVLRAKMLFGSTVEKAPLYQRISKSATATGKNENADCNDSARINYSTFGVRDNSQVFSAPAINGGGVIEGADYYDLRARKKQIAADTMHPLEKLFIEELPADPVVRNPELKLVENGGASIDKIVEYYHKHGECI